MISVHLLGSVDDADYAADNITPTFIAETTTATINIPITIDSHIEELETFNLSIVLTQSLPPSRDGRLSIRSITTAIGRIFDK